MPNGPLMVLIPDELTALVRKGEITDRYYNPGDLFDEVHLVLVNDDRPDPAAVQRTAGRARLHLHNVPAGKDLFARTLGWRPWLLNDWAEAVVGLARAIRPALIRCHGAALNAYAAYRIKLSEHIPYVVSIHTARIEGPSNVEQGWRGWLLTRAQEDIERIALTHADLVMPVYQSIVPRLRRLGVERYDVCYNALNPAFLTRKIDYRLHDPLRIISVGRLFKNKNPDNIVRAVALMPEAHLTLVGDGSHFEYLQGVVASCGAESRVTMHRSLPNDEVCRRLPDYDLFAVHTDYRELPKAVIEPLLTGLPVVINRRLGEPVPELSGEICMLVENTAGGYLKAFEELATDAQLRERLGRSACQHAQAHWSPRATEAKFVEIYRRFMLNQRA